MRLGPSDLRDIHAVFGASSAIVDRRRATYSAVIELATGRSDPTPAADLLDSPVVRAHLGELISGSATYSPDAMTPLSLLSSGADTFSVGGAEVAVVRDPAARAALDGAVRHIATELGCTDGSGDVNLLLDGDPGYEEASQLVVEGLELAATVCPALAVDLLPHVALFAIVSTDDRADALGSASVREYPGLVVVPRPACRVEVAEALVHEGAHQKFFDLGLIRSIVAEDSHRAPAYSASWSATGGSSWPLEQCFAAFHAYTCLAIFEASMREYGLTGECHEFSLLPVAEVRAAELGEWVNRNSRFLGPDGQCLARMLSGDVGRSVGVPPQVDLPRGAGTVVRDCGGWRLLARTGQYLELYWVPSIGLERGAARAPGAVAPAGHDER
jgi:hypothetical protein